MKLIIFLALTTVFSATAFAQNAKVTETKTKITCVTDYVANQSYEGGPVSQNVINRKTSESIRTTWSDGTSEHRLSDFKTFDDNGDVMSVGRSMAKFASETKGKQVTEKTQSNSVSRFADKYEMRGGNLKEYKDDDVNVYYQLSANERVLLSTTQNGKEELTHDLRETTTKINDRVTSVRYIESTPYVESFDGYKIEVLKSERTCEFEVL